MFHLQLRLPVNHPAGRNDWRTIAVYSETRLDDACAACNRAVLSEKCPSRVVEALPDFPYPTMEPMEPVVYEKFYNIRQDPDENWRDDLKEEEFDIRWQENGF